MHKGTILWGDNIQVWSTTRPLKSCTLKNMSSLQQEKKTATTLGIVNYLGNFSPSTTEVCEPLEEHIPKLYERAKSIIQKDTSTNFCNEKEQLYLQKDVKGVA